MNDLQLINAISSGDADAIDTVIRRYSRLVWRVVSAVLDPISVQDVEECVADVFVHLWAHPEKYDPDRGSLKTWLTVTAKSRAIDRYRELTRRRDVSIEDTPVSESEDSCQHVIRVEDSENLLSAVQQLAQPEKEIIVRRFFYEEKPRDIARALGLTVKSVDNHLYRAKQKLRNLIEGK